MIYLETIFIWGFNKANKKKEININRTSHCNWHFKRFVPKQQQQKCQWIKVLKATTKATIVKILFSGLYFVVMLLVLCWERERENAQINGNKSMIKQQTEKKAEPQKVK